jgi:hypothetical protein
VLSSLLLASSYIPSLSDRINLKRIPMFAKTEGYRQLAKRILAVGVFLLVPALTFLCLAPGVLGALRGESAAGGPLLDSRSFAPLTTAKPIPASAQRSRDEDGALEVHLTVWENTGNRNSNPN